MCCVTLTDLQMLKYLCIPGINPTWYGVLYFWTEFGLLIFKHFLKMFTYFWKRERDRDGDRKWGVGADRERNTESEGGSGSELSA